MKNNRIKFKLILPKFQMSLILFFSTFIVGGFIFSFGIVNYFFYMLKMQLDGSGFEKNSILYTFVDKQQFDLNILLLIASSVTVSALIFAGIIYSHKMAGAIYRIIKDLNKITEDEGEVFDIKVRENDHFQELPEAINSAFKAIDSKTNRAKKAS